MEILRSSFQFSFVSYITTPCVLDKLWSSYGTENSIDDRSDNSVSEYEHEFEDELNADEI